MNEIYNGQTVALGGPNLVTKELVVDDSTGEKAEFTYDKTTGAIAVQDEVDKDSVNPVTGRAVAKAIEQGGGGGSDLPEYTAADEDKVLGVVVSGETADIEWVEPQGAAVVEVQYSTAAAMFDTVKDAYLAGQDVIISKASANHRYKSVFQLIGVRRAVDPETGYRTGDPDQFLFGAVDTSGADAKKHLCNCVVTLDASTLSYVESPILPSYPSNSSYAGKVLRISAGNSPAPEWSTINELELIPVSALNAGTAETLYGVIGNAISAGKLPVLVTANSTNSADKRYWPLTHIENIPDPSYGFNAYRFTVIEQVFNSGSSPMLYDLYQEDIIVAHENTDDAYSASAHRYQVATAVAQTSFDPFTA